MHSTLESLQAEALRLPAADRARLLECLLASLEADAAAEAAWDALADAREAALDDKTARAVPLAEALARLEAQFPR